MLVAGAGRFAIAEFWRSPFEGRPYGGYGLMGKGCVCWVGITTVMRTYYEMVDVVVFCRESICAEYGET